MHSLDVSGYINWASFLIFKMSVSGRPRREWRNQGIEMASLGTALQALHGGKLQCYMMQTVSGGLIEREWEWQKMVQLENCLPSFSRGPEFGSSAPIKSQAWWHMLVTLMLGGR